MRLDEHDMRLLALGLLPAVQQAAIAVLRVREQRAAPTVKNDGSPVTQADVASEAIITAALERLAPGVAIVAEEARAGEGGTVTPPGDTFFLVDPLDGTREFISGRAEFTINVALVKHGVPRFGLIYAPALERLYVTLGPDETVTAQIAPDANWQRALDGAKRLRSLRAPDGDARILAASRSHGNAATEAWIAAAGISVASRIDVGSSLKFVLLAEGAADIYPRLATTMEWDTAAGEAILTAAGGTVTDADGHGMVYGKATVGFRNPGFIAWRDPADPILARLRSAYAEPHGRRSNG